MGTISEIRAAFSCPSALNEAAEEGFRVRVRARTNKNPDRGSRPSEERGKIQKQRRAKKRHEENGWKRKEKKNASLAFRIQGFDPMLDFQS